MINIMRSNSSSFRIAISGDFFIDEANNNNVFIGQELKNYFSSFDARIINLESPILPSKNEFKILKTGPNIRTSEETVIPVLKNLQIDLVTLANNHIFDYGDNGFIKTVEALDKASIKIVGAGKTIEDAQAPKIIKLDCGIQIALLNFCENEFSTLSINNYTANPYNLVENCKQIINAKSKYDKIICIVHGGHEYIDVPSPRMINAFRTLVDFGADAVLCHHAHCISTHETYKDAPIFYGLGNFLFTLPSKHECWYSGLVVELEIFRDQPIKFDFKIVSQDKTTFSVDFSSDSVKKSVMARINYLSESLKRPNELQNLWEREIFALKDEYLSLVSPSGSFSSKWLISFFWRTKLFRRLFTPSYTAIMLNMLRCEAHRDALELILKQKLHDSNTQ